MSKLPNIFWNPGQRRLRALWRLAIIVVIFVVTNVALSAIAGVIMMARLLQYGTVPSAEVGALARTLIASPEMQAAAAFTSLLSALASLWLGARFIDRRPFAGYGLGLKAGWWADYGFGLALGALLMAGIFAVERGLGWVTVTGTFQTRALGQPFLSALAIPLIVFFCVGIYEELLTRGLLLRELAEGLDLRRIGPRWAVALAWVLSAIGFGLLHASNPNATPTSTANLMVAGLFLGLGFVLTGELGISIGIHMTWNFFQGNVFGFPVSGGDYSSATFVAVRQGGPALWTGGAFGPEAGLIGLVAMLVGSVAIVLWVRARRSRLALAGGLSEYAGRQACPLSL